MHYIIHFYFLYDKYCWGPDWNITESLQLSIALETNLGSPRSITTGSIPKEGTE